MSTKQIAKQRIAMIDRQIASVRRNLCRSEQVEPLSAESWQSAWGKHPALRAKEVLLFAERGLLQIVAA